MMAEFKRVVKTSYTVRRIEVVKYPALIQNHVIGLSIVQSSEERLTWREIEDRELTCRKHYIQEFIETAKIINRMNTEDVQQLLDGEV